MKLIMSILCVASLCAAANLVCAAESTNNAQDVIRFGIAQSTLIIAGKFGRTGFSGGGATSMVEVGEVLKAPKDFQPPRQIDVYWLFAKQSSQLHTTTFLLFLRPATTNVDTGYHDVTEKAHPFIEANEVNMSFLKSQLLEQVPKAQPNQTVKPTCAPVGARGSP